jgi:peptidyl-prolyl cis-trans isomerase SurA
MKYFLLFFSLSAYIFADILGGIAIRVDDEPITLYEIKQEQRLSHTDVKTTVDNLIRLKLEQIEAKKRNISVTNQEVLDDLKKMAQQNNMTLSQLYEAMQSVRKLTESQTKAKTKEKLLKQKLFNAIALSQMDEPTEDEVKEYYDLHVNEYSAPRSIDVMVYRAASKAALEQKIANPMLYLPEVTTESTRLDTAKINPRLTELLVKTPDSHFTPVLPQAGSNGHMAFYVQSKNDMNTPPLEVVRAQVENKIMEDKREHILNEHFQRMRVNAQIKVLRLPE